MINKHLVFKASILMMILMILVVSFSLSPLINQQPPENDESDFGGPVPIEKIAEKLTLEQLIARLKEINASISLPTWMPKGFKLTMIYYKPPVILLVYSDRGITDYKYANVTIEVSLWYYGPPTKEELEDIASRSNNDMHARANKVVTKVVSVKNTWVLLTENARVGFPGLKPPYNIVTLADFIYSDKHHYEITILPPLTTQDLINIIESMQAVP